MHTLVVRVDGGHTGSEPRLRDLCAMISRETVGRRRRCVIVTEPSRLPHQPSTLVRLLAAARRAAAGAASSDYHRASSSAAVAATPTPTAMIARIECEHIQLLRRCVRGGTNAGVHGDEAEREALRLLHRAREICSAIQVLGEVPPRSQDLLVSIATRLAANAVAATLACMGLPAVYITGDSLADPRHSGPPDDVFYSTVAANLAAEISSRCGRQSTSAEEDSPIPIAVIAGAFGPFPATHPLIRTLGPSHATVLATLIANHVMPLVDQRSSSLVSSASSPSSSSSASSLTELRLVNAFVGGIHTADPRVVPNARLIRTLSVDEAAEMAGCGVGVRLLGSHVDASIGKDVPVRIQSLKNANASEEDEENIDEDARGTVVFNGGDCHGLDGSNGASVPRQSGRYGATAIVTRSGLAVISVDAGFQQPMGTKVTTTAGSNGDGAKGANGDGGGGNKAVRLISTVFRVMEAHNLRITAVSTGVRSVSVAVLARPFSPYSAEEEDDDRRGANDGHGRHHEHHHQQHYHHHQHDGDHDHHYSSKSRRRSVIDKVADELASVGSVNVETNRAMITVVGRRERCNVSSGGDKDSHSSSVEAVVVGAVEGAGVGVELCSRGGGGCAAVMSVVVRETDVEKGVRAVHQRLFE